MCLQQTEECEIRQFNEIWTWEQEMWITSSGVNTMSALERFFLLGHQLFRVVLECWAAKPATELLYTRGVMRTPEMERILNPAKLEEYHRRGLNWKEHSKDMMFYFILFSPQFRGTSYTMISSEIALQEEWELFKWKTCAQLLFSWLIVYSYAQKPSYCNISMILVFLVFFLWQSVHQCTKLVF